MSKGRLEAFSDGVIAIIITIMVLELRPPHGGDWHALQPLLPSFVVYLLSFVFVGIYWNNHHHMFHVTDHIHGGILWANHALLFFLSLIPFATAWMGEHHDEPLPTATYGFVMLLAAQAYTILAAAIYRAHGPDSRFARAVGDGARKGVISRLLYASSIPAAWLSTWVSDALLLAVALMWLIPARRIETVLAKE
jgi:uncharacterized membrane protein